MHGTLDQRFRVEWRSLAELGPLADGWRALAEHALEPNAFYEPAFVQAAGPVFGPDAGAVLVWWGSPPQQLVGFFPARIERRRCGLALPVLVGWTHPYAPLGVPLVHRDMGEAVIAAWLDHVAGQAELPPILLLPYLPLEGPVARALDAVVARRGGRTATLGRHCRALLAPAGGRGDYLERALGHKKRKELRRQRKRLADKGVVMTSSVGDPVAIVRALDDFVALEAGGWKGRAGTAVRAHADVRQFLQSAVCALAREGKARIDRLFVDTRAVAAIVTLRSGATAWCWKIAYDERFARFSPGLQLLLDTTRELLADPALARADSCATANHPMIDHAWRERLLLGDRVICPGPGCSAAFRLACALEWLRRAAIGGAKRLRGLVR